MTTFQKFWEESAFDGSAEELQSLLLGSFREVALPTWNIAVQVSAGILRTYDCSCSKTTLSVLPGHQKPCPHFFADEIEELLEPTGLPT